MTTSDSKSPDPVARTFSMLCASSDTWPPFRVDVDVLFGKKLHQRGHEIDWILQSEAEQPNNVEVSWDGWRVLVGATNTGEKLHQRMHKHFLGIANDFRLLSQAKTRHYDFIQVKDKFIAALFAMRAARKNNSKFIYWLSYPFPEASLHAAAEGTARYPLLYRIRGWFFKLVLYKLVAKRAAHIFVQSEQMKRDMIAEGVPEQLMTAVPMGIEPGAVQPPLSASEQVPSGGYPTEVPGQMIYLGTLLRDRKLDFLVRVLSEVRKTLPTATLLMVGPEEQAGDMDLLRAEATRLGVLDALTITGRMDRDAAFELVRNSQVCFSPFYPTPILNSTSPTKLVEYFSLFKPAVANDHPEQRQVLEASGGGHCVAWDEKEFAAAAIKLMSNPEEAGAMGERGYNWVMQHRTYDVISAQVNNTYLQILQQDSPG